MGYFCTECKRKHHSGKIYKEHKHLEKIKIDDIPYKKVINFNYDLLPNIAKRQIMVYVRKMAWDRKSNQSKQREMYIQQVNKVILRYDTETPIIL